MLSRARLERIAERVLATRKERAANGLCIYCGERPPKKNKRGCRWCMEANRKAVARRRRAKKQNEPKQLALPAAAPAPAKLPKGETWSAEAFTKAGAVVAGFAGLGYMAALEQVATWRKDPRVVRVDSKSPEGETRHVRVGKGDKWRIAVIRRGKPKASKVDAWDEEAKAIAGARLQQLTRAELEALAARGRSALEARIAELAIGKQTAWRKLERAQLEDLLQRVKHDQAGAIAAKVNKRFPGGIIKPGTCRVCRCSSKDR